MLMLLDNILRIIPKLFLAALYLFFTGIILIYCNEYQFANVLIGLKDPIYTFKYSYHYIIWWIDHRENIEIKYLIYILIAFVLPYFAFFSSVWLFKKVLIFLKFAFAKFITLIWKKLKRKKQGNDKTPTSTTIVNHQPHSDTEKMKKEIMDEISKVIDNLIDKNKS